MKNQYKIIFSMKIKIQLKYLNLYIMLLQLNL